MNKYISILKNTNMFNGITENEILGMLKSLNASTVTYKYNEYILRYGENVTDICMVLDGLALIEKEDIWGNRSIISEISAGVLYAESYACLTKLPAEISVIASEDTTVMLFDMRRILTICSSSCTFHTKLIQNLLQTIAQKNVLLTKKIEYISKKTIKEKLLAYLSSEAMKANSSTFCIPFNRQELSDFLAVDRSALSTEIGKLKKSGVIACSKNKFTILNPDL